MGKGRKLAAAGAAILALKAAAVCGAGAVASSWLEELFDSGRMVSASTTAKNSTEKGSSSTPSNRGRPAIS